MRSYFPNEIYEQKTNRYYKLENFKFSPGGGVYKIDEDSVFLSLLTHIDVLISPEMDYSVFMSTDGYRLGGEYRYVDNHYHLEYKLIPRKVGLYYHRSGPHLLLHKNQTFEGQFKRKNNLDGAVKINNGDAYENNVEFLKDAPDNTFALNSYYRHEQFNRLGGYCFYVVE